MKQLLAQPLGSRKHKFCAVPTKINRTVKLKINLPLDAARRTVRAWADACNAVSRVAFENGCISNKVRLQQLAYDVAKSTGLSAQVATSCIRQVAGNYATIRASKRRLTRPSFFRDQAVILQGGPRGRDVSMLESGLSVWTVDGRFKGLTFSGPQALIDRFSGWAFGGGRLAVSGEDVFLTLSFSKEVESPSFQSDSVVGVDRGINVLACATDGKRHWMRKGGHTKHVRNRYLNVRSSLQRKKAESPTRSVAKALKRLSGRGARFMTAVNHEVSKSIVAFAGRSNSAAIAIEDLGGIQKSRLSKAVRGEVRKWAHAQLAQFTEYKAAERGIPVIKVDPRGTSKGCSRCGHAEAANRKRHQFQCKECGHKLHSDLNAAHNIRLRGILAWQDLSENGQLSCCPEVRPIGPEQNSTMVADKLPVVAGSA